MIVDYHMSLQPPSKSLDDHFEFMLNFELLNFTDLELAEYVAGGTVDEDDDRVILAEIERRKQL